MKATNEAQKRRSVACKRTEKYTLFKVGQGLLVIYQYYLNKELLIDDIGKESTPDDNSSLRMQLSYFISLRLFSRKSQLSLRWVISIFAGRLPDVPVDRLFPSWIRALRLDTHMKWLDQKTTRYDPAVVNAFYSNEHNVVVLPSAILSRPFFFSPDTRPLNYGGVGAVRIASYETPMITLQRMHAVVC